MTMMMCNDLMCTLKLTRSQLSLAHGAKVKTDMPEKNEQVAQLSQRDRAAGGMANSGRPELGDDILRYRFIFNHFELGEKNAK